MKRCLQCGREYDSSMMFCLDDGAELFYGPASMDEPATAIIAAGAGYESRTEIYASPGRSGERALNSIAVLPFANVSPDPENEYFCDGLAEELLNALAKIDDLKVAARTSAFSFKGRSKSVSEIATALNVRTVLEGSVRKSHDRLRITAQLVNAEDGFQLWSERYDREMKDIFVVQDEIALAVVDALKVELLGEERSAVLKRHTESAEAHEFYLRGLAHFNRWTPFDFEKAIENFDRAIAIDPEYASAYAALADAYTELLFFSFSSSDARLKARKAADRALELDDSLAEAHNSRALIKLYFDWDYAAAEDEFKRAVELNPGSAAVRMWYGWYLGIMARFDEGLSELARARELDPLSPPNINAIGVVLHWSGRTDRAIEQFQNVLELHPGYPICLSFLAEAYAQKGDLASALTTIEEMRADTMDPQALAVAGYLYAQSGHRDKAHEILNRFAGLSSDEYVPALNFAQIFAGLGDNERALDSLEKACEERAIWIPFLKVDVKFASLRSEPRFKALLRKAGFAE
jgi:serine/threonine-protein kinase